MSGPKVGTLFAVVIILLLVGVLAFQIKGRGTTVIVVTPTPDQNALVGTRVAQTVSAQGNGANPPANVTSAQVAASSPTALPVPQQAQSSPVLQPPVSTQAPVVPAVLTQPSPTTVPIPQASVSSGLPRELKKNETVSARKYTVISGDILVNGVPQWPSNNTMIGLVVILDQDASVTAPFGASMIEAPDSTSAGTLANMKAQEVRMNGCTDGKGCSSVIIKHYPSGNQV